MTSRERFLAALYHHEADRVPIDDTPWDTTVARWHREGLPADQTPRAYFGFERHMQGFDQSFGWAPEVLDDSAGQLTSRDADGVTVRTLPGRETVPLYLDFTIGDARTWAEHRERLAWHGGPCDLAAAAAANRAIREADGWVMFAAGFGYDKVQRFVGAERVLEAVLDQPAWVKDMVDTLADQIIAGADAMIAAGCRFDAAFLWNDQAYRNGPFFSPAAHRALEFPAQRRLCDFFGQHGIPVILHSDGDVRPLLGNLLDAGFAGLQPLEAKAGMDVVELKAAYGDRLVFMGGIDTRAMAHPDPAVIEREIARKLPAAKRGGGYIYHSDHSVPDNVSFAQYCRVMELVHRYGRFD